MTVKSKWFIMMIRERLIELIEEAWWWFKAVCRLYTSMLRGQTDSCLPAAFFAAYRFASSCALPIFFLYLILLLPNQFDTCNRANKRGLFQRGYVDMKRVWAVSETRPSTLRMRCAPHLLTLINLPITSKERERVSTTPRPSPTIH